MRYLLVLSIVTSLIIGATGASAASPDLIVSSLVRTPFTPTIGQAVSFAVSVKNVGNAPAGSSWVELRVDGLTFTKSIGSLSAGAEQTVVFTWIPGRAGSYRAETCADAGDAVRESNETNNCSSQTFKVIERPRLEPSVNLKVNGSDGPVTVTFGSSVNLTWTSKNVNSCFASGGWFGSKPASGSETVSPRTDTTYTLTCDGANDSVTVRVTPPPAPTVTLTASATTIIRGESAILTWRSTNATVCRAYAGWLGTKALVGSEIVSPIFDTTYSLTCSNETDEAVASVIIFVREPPPAKPTVTLTTSPTTIVLGESAVLTWTSTNADTCAASGGWSGFRAASGSELVFPNQSTTYTLTCSNAAGSASASAAVTIQTVLPSVNLTASPTTISRGESAILNWSSSNADNCFAFGGWSGGRAISGSEVIVPDRTTTYLINCTNMSGSVSASATVTVAGTTAGNPPAVDLDAQPRNIIKGESSVLFWTSTNAETCTASGGWSGTRGPSGSESVSPTRMTTYTLVCTNEAGSGIGNVTVFIRNEQGAAPTVNLDANPTRVNPGTPVILVWSSTNADSCFASGGWSGAKSRAGGETVTPTINTTYTLTCSNENGVASASRTVFIGFDAAVSFPTPTLIQPFRAACVASPSQARLGETVTFAGGETGGTSPVTFNWSGALSGTGLVRTASFSTTGAKTALLTVIDSNGRSATASCSVDIVAPVTAAPTTPTVTPPPAAPPVTLTFRNITLAPETPERNQSLLSTIFGEGVGRLLAILFLILLNAAFIFLLIWLYQRVKREKEERTAVSQRPLPENLPQELFGPEIT